MKHKHTERCGRMCVRCTLWSAGFLVEHILWERVPFFRLIPPLLGIQ